MRYLSLFSGIGGFELGIARAAPRAKCIGYSEIDPYAIQIYQQHYPTHTNYGDITKIKAEDLPEFDLIVGGFPCQSFSIAGKRGGFADTRGTLFFDIARIIKAKQPRLLLLENVKGLLSHDKGDTFRTIIATLDELGYDLQWQVLNSKDFGVPQNRERVLIVGHLGKGSRSKVFPFDESGTDDSAGTLEATYHKGGHTGTYPVEAGTLRHRKEGVGFRPMKSGLAPTLNARARSDGDMQPVIIARNQRGETRKMSISGSLAASKSSKQFSYLAYPLKARQDSGIDAKHPQTLIHSRPHGFNKGGIRRLTPTECERLQGFPDNWTKYGSNDREISDTQRYKTLGNAVTVNVIHAIMDRLLK